MALLKPLDIVDHCGGPGFDAVVIANDRGILADLGVGEALELLLSGEPFDIVAQRALVAFHARERNRPFCR